MSTALVFYMGYLAAGGDVGQPPDPSCLFAPIVVAGVVAWFLSASRPGEP